MEMSGQSSSMAFGFFFSVSKNWISGSVVRNGRRPRLGRGIQTRVREIQTIDYDIISARERQGCVAAQGPTGRRDLIGSNQTIEGIGRVLVPVQKVVQDICGSVLPFILPRTPATSSPPYVIRSYARTRIAWIDKSIPLHM